jgi:LAS superfamily LD-carboxypeptidase LdcB
MKLPIVEVKLCSHLKNAKPGQLSADKLRKIEGGGQLHHCAADAYEAMDAAAKAEGIELKPTSAGDTYRTLAAQLAGFNQRYQLEPIEGQSTRTYEGKKWYLKKGMAPLAAPGTSKHNLRNCR